MGKRHCFAFQEPRDEDARGGAAGGNSGLRWLFHLGSNGTYERMVSEVVHAFKAIFAGREAQHSRMGGRGASGPVGSEHGLSREIRKSTDVWVGAVDKFLNLGFVDSRRLESGCTR